MAQEDEGPVCKEFPNAMQKIIYTLLAEKDLEDIWQYIAEDSVKRASNFLRLIERKIRYLSKNPLAGRARTELVTNLRSFPVGNYMLFYQPSAAGVKIVRVLHGARDIKNLF